MNIAVLGSTSGTDLQEIIDKLESKELTDIKISFVLSNKENAYILKRAKKHNIKSIFLDPKDKSREEYDKEIAKILKDNNAELIVLIGYMKYMSKWFVDEFKNKVMNIHPSLLPMFAGGMDKNVHQAVLDYGCKITGATLMFIDEGEDTGPVILQEAVQITNDETVDTLKDKVQTAEKKIIIKGIELFRDGKLQVQGRIVKCK